MQLVDFQAQPVWLNLLVFGAAAAVVWFAGTRLSRYANAISERTGIGKAFIGMILLGGITSLPEVAVIVSAALGGAAELAATNMLGSVAINVAVLAAGDLLVREAISSIVAAPVVLLQATLDVLLLVVVALGITVGGPAPLGIGVWSLVLFGLYFVALWLVKVYQSEPTWEARSLEDVEEDEEKENGAGGSSEQEEQGAEGEDRKPEPGERSLRQLLVYTAAAAAAILVAGYLLSRTGEAIAAQTGLGQSFVGVTLVSISTSLPEVSTVFAAIRIGEYELAFSDVFGTNFFNLALLVVVDLLIGQPVFELLGNFSVVATLLGIALITVYMAGLIERKDRRIGRLGIDSAVVLASYAAGMVLLYTLR